MFPTDSGHCDICFFSVRRITSKVCFRRHLEVQPATSLGRTKTGVTTSEAKSRGGMYGFYIASFSPLAMDNLTRHRNSVEVYDGSSANDDLP